MSRALLTRLFSKASWQCLLILSAATVVGLAGNQLRTNGLPLMGQWSDQEQSSNSGSPLSISLQDAEMMFFTGSAVFLDARPPELYQLGHIKGAYNLPWEDFQNHFDQVVAAISQQTTIITYCDGNGCSLSNELALFLLDKGYPDVRVLVNGWTLWQENDLPIEFGESNNFS